MPDPTTYTLAAEPALRLTLAQAVEVLNRVGHREVKDWRVEQGTAPYVASPSLSQEDFYVSFEAIALAEYYLRHGLTAWPGWEWQG